MTTPDVFSFDDLPLDERLARTRAYLESCAYVANAGCADRLGCLRALDEARAAIAKYNAIVKIIDQGDAEDPPECCAGCGVPGLGCGGAPDAHALERALHWKVRGAWVCLECFGKENRTR